MALVILHLVLFVKTRLLNKEVVTPHQTQLLNTRQVFVLQIMQEVSA